ncbi:MAG: Trehalose-6-phosphate phosphatase [uncultured Corynebacteriales bacterium]|uniref:Trehalose 6-phosphate phosphatase n=1 Tax=uncultured Mycobacteriales bacterium TaxID=581187 RepID=A0A6J4HA21_9ACTN|nr:MAG: Trehalose-6-phosphate phosphatase [uncultured Corynebacteriales bacterium]
MDAPAKAGWDALVADPAGALVALDYDGVLAPIVEDPTLAVPAPGAIEVLRRLAERVGTLAVVTGRPAAQVVELGGLATVPGLIVEGQYGAERWVGGELTTPEEPAGVTAARAAPPAALAAAGADPAVWVEDKRLALVVHARRTADPDAELGRLDPAVRRVAEKHGLEPHPGKMVVELRAPGFDKGGVLRRLAAAAGSRAVLFAGDDLGDIPGFAAVEELRAAGTPGITVASASPEAAAVAERADVAVDGPAGVVTLLVTLSDQMSE